jgi:DNA-directed RNA polymerase specialized sigma24 family protein
MQLRERRARRQIALDDIQSALASDAANPEALCYLAELQAAHMKAASSLPKVLYDVYAERVISDVAFPEVIHHLGLTPAAAKSRLFRARKKVQPSLQSVIQGRAA